MTASAPGDFEGRTLPELHAMLAGARPADVTARAARLKAAARHVRELGERLSCGMKAVDWDGESGDAFREWTRQLCATTQDFADYTESISDGLASAGAHLGSTKAGMPAPLDTTITQERYRHYQPALDLATTYFESPETNEAVNLMTSLSSTYRTTAEDFRKPPPVFGPLPLELVPADPDEGEGQVAIADGAEERMPVSSTEAPQHLAPSPAQGMSRTPAYPHVQRAHSATRASPHTTWDSVSQAPRHEMAPAPLPRQAAVDGGGPMPMGIPLVTGWSSDRLPDDSSRGIPSPTAPSGSRAAVVPDVAPDDGITGGFVAGGRAGTRGGGGGLVIGRGEEPQARAALGAHRPFAEEVRQEPSISGHVTGPDIGFHGVVTPDEKNSPLRQASTGAVKGFESGGSANRRRGRSEKRPHYLVEDPETWNSDRCTVPPVIE
jgi:uncharacterized protein YukE